MALFALPVALVAYAVRERWDALVSLDETVAVRATDLARGAGLGPSLTVLQAVSQPWVLYAVATATCVWAWLARGLRTRALWAFVTMMVAWNVGLLLKLVVHRARPVIDDPLSHAPGYSFPSGHAFNAAVVATVVVFLLWPLLSPTARRVSTMVAVVGVLAVGLDRVFLGVHFASDVVAGWVLGFGISLASWVGFIGTTQGPSSAAPSPPA
ncbi:phosphatase PAP2 family protein [Knoellia koreensis]|uniref:Phosphatase PAP2 family protein n=1 Tax=Knoellia koreensis TaxID=2730921 RepID=A0A849HCD7_9MICO|nr:phosphatase PAP2 family protein [Knoellia sp. DB2414S]NNM47406.1 phosphatase PAP2 family protein [Knoellia sp. DB2414S]